MLDTLSFINDYYTVAAAASTDTLATGIRNFVGPIVLLIISLVAITFLFRREMTQFFIFIVIAIAVALLFYAPGIIRNLAQGVGNQGGQSGEWKGR